MKLFEVLAVLVAFDMAVIIPGCVIADLNFPRIPFIERMIDRLPLGRDEPASGGRKDNTHGN